VMPKQLNMYRHPSLSLILCLQVVVISNTCWLLK